MLCLKSFSKQTAKQYVILASFNPLYHNCTKHLNDLVTLKNKNLKSVKISFHSTRYEN